MIVLRSNKNYIYMIHEENPKLQYYNNNLNYYIYNLAHYAYRTVIALQSFRYASETS
jgi:hypothetical protein